MTIIEFPAAPFPLLATVQTRHSGFSCQLRSSARLANIVDQSDALSLTLEGIAREDEAPEQIAQVSKSLIAEIDSRLNPVGRRIFDYDLEANEGRIDLFVLLAPRMITGGNC